MAYMRASQGGSSGSSISRVDDYFNNTITIKTTATFTGLSSYSKVIIILGCSFQTGKSKDYMKDYCYMDGRSPFSESGMYKNTNSSSHLVRTYVIDNTFGDSLTITGKWNSHQVIGVN